MRIQFSHTYENIISEENLLAAWKQFLQGKRSKNDVQDFEYRLADNVLKLHKELRGMNYTHGGYYAFNISDPKPRNIHKALVRDRLLHHALYRELYPFFDKVFIADSYSCRRWKGTHRALNRFKSYINKVGKNNTKTVWVLKCDVRKFFASIDHAVLSNILKVYIPDQKVISLLNNIVASFESTGPGKGLPLGNLTSQLLVNIYMNEFDQFVKHKLKATHYIRYADDFAILSQDKKWLMDILPRINAFLLERLKLQLHPDKVSISTLAAGIDFLGWVHFPEHRVLRSTTKKRMLKNLAKDSRPEVLQSYLGLLKHGNSWKIRKSLITNS